MADGTKIEWADATLNYVNGCSLESPGCTNCYAMKQAHRFPVRQGLTVKTKGGMVWTGEVRENPRALEQALAWKRGRAIFWNAHGDLFHPSVPDEWIDRQFAVCALTPQHRHMILTKRSARMREYVSAFEDRPDEFGAALAYVVRAGGLPKQAGIDLIDDMLWPLPSVWLGVSAEDQQRWDERTADLRQTPAAVRFVSGEPLLGLIVDKADMTGIDWVIAGGESGPGARPMHPDWARSLRDQCSAAGVAFHFKQFGDWAPGGEWDFLRDPSLAMQKGFATILPDGTYRGRGFFPRGAKNAVDIHRVGKKCAGRQLDGVEHNGVPAHG